MARMLLAAMVLTIAGVTVSAQAASADEGEASDEGYVIVQQALSYLVNEPGATGAESALMKVDEALAAEDQDGVTVADVEQAKIALNEGDEEAARKLLQRSIAVAVDELKPATGIETGTTVMLAPIPPRAALGSSEWLLLALSAVIAAVGVSLSVLFRPRESMKDLTRDILAARGLRRTPASARPSEGSRDVNRDN